MIIGRHEDAGHGGRIDILALAPDGALILIELKRAKTPREAAAQALDDADRAEFLDAEHLGRSSNRPVIGPIVSICGAGSAFFARSLAEMDDYTPDMMFCGCYDRDYGILNCSAVSFL